MLSVGFPDWKKIGWHLGKRLKDILNPPSNTDPSPEERCAQRLRDGLKGFVYFDDFEEVEAWSEDDVDPIQQANTPLLKRPQPCDNDDVKAKPSVMLCHDYKGGYHDYESVRPPLLDEKWYSCEYLQFVETFIYFSHKLVCVPPPTWTNTLHRNGVKVLGTFLVEPQTLHLERMFNRINGEYSLAKQLAAMADAYGFDGWLLNIEAEFPNSVSNVADQLIDFIRNLRRLLSLENMVVWYDALNINNDKDYQNGLTWKNAPFAAPANALFTNYKWTDRDVRESQQCAAEFGYRCSDIYFGVDVWAQNTNMPGPPRVTYPSKGGGGTNTGLALDAVGKNGMSAAIFAPAWTYEHFPTASHSGISVADNVEQAMWEGGSLFNQLDCDCRQGRPHHTQGYREKPITEVAREFAAGDSFFFESDFTEAFELQAHTDLEDGKRFRSTLGYQATTPRCIPMPRRKWEQLPSRPPTRVLYSDRSNKLGPGFVIKTRVFGDMYHALDSDSDREVSSAPRISHLELFKLDMTILDTLEAIISYQNEYIKQDQEFGFYSKHAIQRRGSEKIHEDYEYMKITDTMRPEPQTMTLSVKPSEAGAHARLIAFGFYCADGIPTTDPIALCRLLHLTINPKTELDVSSFGITNFHVTEKGPVGEREKRLVWSWNGSRPSWPRHLPWSRTTGPFSYFIVKGAKKELGRACSTEFPLRDDDFEDNDSTSEDEIEVVIEGVMFGGEKINSVPVRISRNDSEMVLV